MEYKIAESLDQKDVIIQNHLGEIYYVERKFALAIKHFKKALEVEERMTLPHQFLAWAYEANQQYDQALDEREKYDSLIGNDPAKTKPAYQKLREVLHGPQGPRGMWETRLAAAEQNPAASRYYIAYFHARLGHTNEAIEFLKQAYEAHDGGMVNLLRHDCWDAFRDDPAFQKWVKKMGFHPVAK
jgi:tetratricopeptide (TPR) repeat protein